MPKRLLLRTHDGPVYFDLNLIEIGCIQAQGQGTLVFWNFKGGQGNVQNVLVNTSPEDVIAELDRIQGIAGDITEEERKTVAA